MRTTFVAVVVVTHVAVASRINYHAGAPHVNVQTARRVAVRGH